MTKLFLTVAAVALLSAVAITPASAGCYRLGLTGYHWYNFCAGPGFIYPHHRVCNRNGYCWYR
jgi:hypothetical protein